MSTPPPHRPQPRKPQVFDADDPHVRETAPRKATVDTDDSTRSTGDTSPGAIPEPRATVPLPERRPRFGLASAFVAAVLALFSLALGLWFTRFVSIALARDDWLGWTANALAIFIAAALGIILAREILGFFRLARLGRLRREAVDALESGDPRAEKRVVARIKALASGHQVNRWALAAFRDQERHHTGPGELLALADRVLLEGADRQARRVIYESARRVAVVTAVVPVAFISVLFVLFENVRMLRRLAAAYGGRPGIIGGWRLLIRVIFYIAATGAIALTDDLFGQFLGQDVMRRLSRRLGEGAFNGALTARLGIAAIELCRPCPHIATKPLRARHVVAELFPEFKPGELMGRATGRRKKPAATAADD